jgi:isopentenyldiphosphate isomerase
MGRKGCRTTLWRTDAYGRGNVSVIVPRAFSVFVVDQWGRLLLTADPPGTTKIAFPDV